MRRVSLHPTAIQAAAAAAVLGLVLAPSPVLARGITTVPSDITGVDNHFPAGLFNWSSSGCGGGGVDFCGTLDFCQDGDRFGYALPGETCQPYNGPTIRLAPGKKYRLTLRNTATFGVSTNIHTHGLHIVGAGDSDDVTRSVDSGDCLDYTWDIADDHPGGTHWYHSHMHLNSESQVGGGAIGLLIVEDNLDLDSDVPLWASYERVLQIFRSPEVGFITNGEDVAELEVEQDRWFRLRVSIVDPLAVPDSFEIDGCEVAKVAHDGIWSSTVPQQAKTRYLLTGSSRADFAVRCSGRGEFRIRFRGRTVGRILSGRARSESIPLGEWNPKRPASLSGLREAFVPRQNTWEVYMSAGGINGIPWNERTPLRTIAYDEVHEWTIHRSEIHPFHKHLYHAMVVSPGGCGELQEGEFYDTIAGNDARGGCRIRFRTSDIGQRELLHCHVFSHSDQGAMGWVNVVGRNMPENNVRSPPYQCRDPVNCKGCDLTSPPSSRPTTRMPTSYPTEIPTLRPTKRPTARPTPSPTSHPTWWDIPTEPLDRHIDATAKTEGTASSEDVALSLWSVSPSGCGDGGCDMCDGDCDTDDDCIGFFQCFMRTDSEAVPGCTGSGIQGT